MSEHGARQLANVSLLGCLLPLLAGHIIVCTGAELDKEGGGIMAACINGNGVMIGQTDPGPKIARTAWALIGDFSTRDQRSARGDPHRKLLIMVRGSIHQRVKLIMNNHQGTRFRQQPYYCTWHRIFSAPVSDGAAESQGVSPPL